MYYTVAGLYMDVKTLVLYLCVNNQVKNIVSLSLQLKYVTTASRMYYVAVKRLRTLNRN